MSWCSRSGQLLQASSKAGASLLDCVCPPVELRVQTLSHISNGLTSENIVCHFAYYDIVTNDAVIVYLA